MSLDYSKVIMVGTGWAVRGESGELIRYATAYEAAGGVVEPVPDAVPVIPLFDVYKVTDGERGKRASRANVSQLDADQYIADHPDDEYEIVPAG